MRTSYNVVLVFEYDRAGLLGLLEAHMIFVNFGAPPHPLEKRTPPPVVMVVTNNSYD